MRLVATLCLAIASGATVVACGLDLAGEESLDAGSGGKKPTPPVDAGALMDGAGGEGGGGTSDAAEGAPEDAPDAPVEDAAPDGGECTPIAADAGFTAALSLAQLTTAGDAVYDENSDTYVTLTNSDNNQAGAAWSTVHLPVVSSYAITWTLREGPDDTAGAGFTFAVLQTATVPSSTFVGNNGDAMGLQGIPGSPTGYAVALYLYGGLDLELVTMPDFTVVASKTTTDALNDGNLYEVDVTWQAPSTLTATVHAPSGLVTVTSSDAGLATTGPAWVGVTASTGVSSDTHYELAGISVARVCQ
jgi:hypothetical protein